MKFRAHFDDVEFDYFPVVFDEKRPETIRARSLVIRHAFKRCPNFCFREGMVNGDGVILRVEQVPINWGKRGVMVA